MVYCVAISLRIPGEKETAASKQGRAYTPEEGRTGEAEGGAVRRILFFLVFFLLTVPAARGAEDALTKLRDETMKFFTPMAGTVTRVEDKEVVMSVGNKEGARPGMRLKVMREGAPFIHPVTKEVIEKTELISGSVEIQKVSDDSSAGVIVDGTAEAGDKVRLSESRIRMLFSQSKTADWSLADAYYRKLKATGKIEMIDSAVDSGKETDVLAEARKRGADVALLLTSEDKGKDIVLRERLFWVADGSQFIDASGVVSADFAKSLKFGEEIFSPDLGEPVMSFDLPFGARLVTAGNVEGDGTQKVILNSGNKLMVYALGVDLRFQREIDCSAQEDPVWLDTIDLNGNGTDEIIVSSLKGDDVVSSVYEFENGDFRRIWQGNYFLRRVGNRLLAQGYSPSDGFKGDVYSVVWDGHYKIGEKIKLPPGINIYDFSLVHSETGNLLFAYDEQGYLNLYDDKGIRLWRSSSNMGGFLTTFKKKSGTFMERGEWSIKDRLTGRQSEVLAVKRIPLAEMARGVGYKSSRLMDYWWNGFSMEEKVMIDGIDGTLLDYALDNGDLFALTKPFLGIKFGNILKGENPFGARLFIYSLKGR